MAIVGVRRSELKVTVIFFACFVDIETWCDTHNFTPKNNVFERRELPKDIKHEINNFLTRDNKKQTLENKAQSILERIWVHYRLMVAIISRTPLEGIAKELITQQFNDPSTEVRIEYKLAVDYFEIGEPDMAGGHYPNELNQNKIDKLRIRIIKTATPDRHVLIRGDSGSGKETVAWAIHTLSERQRQPFVRVNCAGFSDTLIQSQLFGHLKGSFTDAKNDSFGLVKEAEGGTLFLDELPELGQEAQANLLRFLESGEYRPVGASTNRFADVRVIAAGQANRLNDKKKFRPDLLARLGALTIDLPPLRELGQEDPETLLKIAVVLLERHTWTTVHRDCVNPYKHKLTPNDIQEYKNKLSNNDEKKLEKLTQEKWEYSNIRQLDNFIYQWMIYGDEVFDNLCLVKENIGEATIYTLSTTPNILGIYENRRDDMIIKCLEDVDIYISTREDLEGFKEPFANLAKVDPLMHSKLMKGVYEIYERKKLYKGKGTGQQRATQKDFAKLIGCEEHQISRLRKA